MDESGVNSPNKAHLVEPEVPKETPKETVERLAKLPQLEYAQLRKSEAKALEIQVADLDRVVKEARSKNSSDLQGHPMGFDDPEPWGDPVDPAATLDEVQAMLSRFVIADIATLQAATLWCVFTHLVDVVKVAPIANITAPEKNCGKSTMLRCLYLLSRCPLKADNISPSAIFRVIDSEQPTLLIDEVDAFLRDNESARGILNSGHEPGGCVIRVVGEEHEPRQFRTFSAKALCGIGSIQSTLESRSIRLELRRKLPDEHVENLKFSDPAQWNALKRKLIRLAGDLSEIVGNTGEIRVPGLSNRAADNWQPLVAIADAAGGHWPKTSRNAAYQLEQTESESREIGAELLRAVKAVFDARGADKVFTRDLLNALNEDEESIWRTYNRGAPLAAHQLADKLKPYGGKASDVRIGGQVARGYKRADLEDAFKRYLADVPVINTTPLQSPHDADLSEFECATGTTSVAPEKPLKPLGRNGCSNVAPGKPPAGDDDVEVF